MAKGKPEDPAAPQDRQPAEVATISDLAQLFGEMLLRDQVMWNRLSERDDQLREQMVGMFQRVVDTNAIDKVLVKGFSEVSKNIAAQTAPLRSLGREYAPLNDDSARRLDALNTALARPNFSMITDQGAIRPLPQDRSLAS